MHVRFGCVVVLTAALGAGCAGSGAGTGNTAGAAGNQGPGAGGAAGGGSSGAAGAGGAAGGAAGTGGAGAGGATTVGGHKLAPGGYYVDGATIYDATSKAHLFHGVARPSLEWDACGEHVAASDFQLMAGWKANVARLAMNQDYWLQNAACAATGTQYQATVDQAIGWAKAAGLDVILDLHWSDKGQLGVGVGQQIMADTNSLTFWTQVATRYKGDGRVMFELYNEPHDVTWDIWQNGGPSGGFQVVGMQQLHDAIRGAGADNLVIIGGLDWAYDLTGVPAHRIAGYNIVYATHPYASFSNKQPANWDQGFGFLSATDPVIVTEFGTFDCSTAYYSSLVSYADQHRISWTAWAWYASGCGFPSVIADWNGTPNAPGMILKTALQGY